MLPHIPRFAYALAALLATAGIVAAAVATSAPGSVTVHDARFVQGPLVDRNLTVDAILYFTSLDRDSRDVRISVYFYPLGGSIAEERREVAVGTIPGQRTTEVRVPLRIASESTAYASVEFLVFEDGLLTQRGSGSLGFARRDMLMDGTYAEEKMQASVRPFERVR